jgi:hypothetical protein
MSNLSQLSLLDKPMLSSSSPLGLQRILHAMKLYGDTWGCCANTNESHVLLVGPPGAVAEARNHDFCWGSAPLQVVDPVKYLGVRLNCAWTWDTHIAAAYHKGLGAFHAWRPVLVSPRISVAGI